MQDKKVPKRKKGGKEQKDGEENMMAHGIACLHLLSICIYMIDR